MKKRIIQSTISVKSDGIIVNIVEEIGGISLPIWKFSTSVKNASNALSTLKSEYRKIFGTELMNVNVVYEPRKSTDWEIVKIHKTHVLVNKEFSEIDMKNIMKSFSSIVKNNSHKQAVKIQPYEYELFQSASMSKKYARLPFGKTGNEIRVYATVTYLNSDIYDHINNLLKQFNVHDFDIFISPEIYINNNEVVEDNDVTFIHVGQDYSFIASVKNNTVQAIRETPEISIAKLIKGISKTLNIDINRAKSDLYIQNTVHPNSHISKQINTIIDKYLNYIVDSLEPDERNRSIVLSGKLLKLKNISNKLNSLIDRDVNIPKSDTYLEGHKDYIDAHSVKRTEYVRKLLTGEKINKDFVKTIPEKVHETYNINTNTRKKGLLSKITGILGGYNE